MSTPPAPPPTGETVTLSALLAEAGLDPRAATWPAVREAAVRAERAGAHVLLLPGPDGQPSATEATTLAAALLRVTGTLRLAVPIDPARTAPYNAARVLASLAHLGPGRVLLARGGEGDAEGWAEYVAAVRALWDSFPADAILADRATGRYFDASRVPDTRFTGRRHRVLGALNLPTPPGGPLGLWPAEEDSR
ncbi:LLM class flavin-dependent oxidoreductase [Streptomyces avicenniae]|uniref:LLM class flavin-dependent oxidoreductase n=1 Tax=Streptomyces avicenniae TaxID=500153 RepID=UPI00069B24B8|nr:LLM class flavin-dependent oxidoreductase [Streptomyces avicenniae]